MKMMKFTTAIALVILLSAGSLHAHSESSITPFQLTCEYLTNPTGLDILRPRFSWKLTATDKTAFGQRQSAYRILVSSGKESLDTSQADMWDSGWVQSDDMQLIRYNGKP
ncbi:MAG: Alpha-L-rhamnosidase [Proteiniphilum acetatigenes]|uniref:Alpha-L-rhamnosidase n=1 Tax=Proteiniphilum acetatigenes TaxID=294710 RepID=A0A101HI31_9BACT|nr:MAG: Alpha-L-rhamnosidase [Proteiniphilum acetatigenes]